MPDASPALQVAGAYFNLTSQQFNTFGGKGYCMLHGRVDE